MEGRELDLYMHNQLIEAIRALAMDYEIQLTLIPSEIHWALVNEIVDDYFHLQQITKSMINAGLMTEGHRLKIEELNQMIDDVIGKDLVTNEALQNNDEWNEIREFSRKLLVMMNEEIRPPYVRRKGDVRGVE